MAATIDTFDYPPFVGNELVPDNILACCISVNPTKVDADPDIAKFYKGLNVIFIPFILYSL